MTKSNNFYSRIVKLSDKKDIFNLYKKSAEIKEGLARTPEEITEEFINDYLNKTVKNGLGIIIFDENKKPAAVLLSHQNEAKTFVATIGNMSLAVDPDFIGFGLGKRIFQDYLAEIKQNHPQIKRVELNVRRNNKKAIAIYESVGFVLEGVMKNRLIDSNGNLSDDSFMAWYKKD